MRFPLGTVLPPDQGLTPDRDIEAEQSWDSDEYFDDYVDFTDSVDLYVRDSHRRRESFFERIPEGATRTTRYLTRHL